MSTCLYCKVNNNYVKPVDVMTTVFCSPLLYNLIPN